MPTQTLILIAAAAVALYALYLGVPKIVAWWKAKQPTPTPAPAAVTRKELVDAWFLLREHLPRAEAELQAVWVAIGMWAGDSENRGVWRRTTTHTVDLPNGVCEVTVNEPAKGATP